VLGDEEFRRLRIVRAHRRFLPGMQVEQYALLKFFERDGFGGQFRQLVRGHPACLLGMCRTAGFARAELIEVHDYGAAVGLLQALGRTGLPACLSG